MPFFCDLGSSKAYAACVLRRDDFVKIGDLISRYRDVLKPVEVIL